MRADRLAAVVAPGIEIWLKCEGQNPTGSFKDRGMTVAVTRALAEGAEAIICASTGNTSASAAAFAARAGIRAYVVVPQGKIALGKLSQAVMHGARVIQIEGNFDQALTLVRDVKERYPTRLALVNSVNPDRIQGQKTAAFEICDALGRAPDYHLLPVGNAGNITAYWRGYREYHEAGIVDDAPRMMGFEAAGAAPLVHGHVVDRSAHHRDRDPDRQPGELGGRDRARDESGGEQHQPNQRPGRIAPPTRHARDRPLPARGIADADRRGDGPRIDHHAVHDRRGARRLEAHHPRQRVDDAAVVILAIAPPVGGDVARVADREK